MFLDEKAAGEAKTAEQKNRKLKLSEAIRIGAQLRPQGRGRFFTDDGGSCALGAASEGATGKAYMVWDALDGMAPLDILNEVECRNDGKGGHEPQTREAIADWLEAQGF